MFFIVFRAFGPLRFWTARFYETLLLDRALALTFGPPAAFGLFSFCEAFLFKLFAVLTF